MRPSSILEHKTQAHIKELCIKVCMKVSMYESSDSQFFRTTTGIQPEPSWESQKCYAVSE